MFGNSSDGIEHGNNQYERVRNNFASTLTQEELAKKIGTTARTMQNYKRLLSMIPELEDLVDTGIENGGDRKSEEFSDSNNFNLISTQKDLAEMMGRRIVELERIYGIKHGGDHGNQYKVANPNYSVLANQEDLAKMLGVSVDTLRNYKALLDMIPELEDLVDTGIVSTATAVAIVGEDQRGSDGLSLKPEERLDDSSRTAKNSSGKMEFCFDCENLCFYWDYSSARHIVRASQAK